MRILIVDDYPGMVELYGLALSARGVEVVGAVTAGEAYVRAISERFDAIVLDVQLPDGDGVELMRRLRDVPALAGKQMVGMSSDNGHGVRDRFDAFLDKPFHPKRLATVLRRLCVERGTARA